MTTIILNKNSNTSYGELGKETNIKGIYVGDILCNRETGSNYIVVEFREGHFTLYGWVSSNLHELHSMLDLCKVNIGQRKLNDYGFFGNDSLIFKEIKNNTNELDEVITYLLNSDDEDSAKALKKLLKFKNREGY